MSSPCERLSRRQREATPPAFARYLIRKVRRVYQCETVAVLWVQERSVYEGMKGVELWGRERDARTYDGPWPVICHPPCGPWSKLAWRCRQSKEDGRIAVRLAHRFGGVIEHPLGTHLFRECGEPLRHDIEFVRQGDYGHRAPKPTLLYWARQDARA